MCACARAHVCVFFLVLRTAIHDREVCVFSFSPRPHGSNPTPARCPHRRAFQGKLRLSPGGAYPAKYAMRFAAGFGSQVAFALYAGIGAVAPDA